MEELFKMTRSPERWTRIRFEENGVSYRTCIRRGPNPVEQIRARAAEMMKAESLQRNEEPK